MELAQFIKKAGNPAPRNTLPFSLVEGGLPQGGLIEISGATGGGKLEALLRFLAENPVLPVAWVEEGGTTYPCAFPQSGVDLSRVLFINAEPAHAEQNSFLMDCAHQILRSQIFGALVLLPKESTFPQSYPHNHHTQPRDQVARSGSDSRGGPRRDNAIDLRRLQIGAEKSGTTVFLIRETPSVADTWPLTAQLQVARTMPSLGSLRGELRVKVLKYRFGSRAESSSQLSGEPSAAAI